MKKQWVIPDIHGCYNTLRTLIEEQIRPSKGDSLYFLGDYIDRGPDSRKVIDYLMELENEFALTLLKGNHEDFLLRLCKEEKVTRKFLGIPVGNLLKADWLRNGGDKTLQSFGVKNVRDIPQQYVDWLNRLQLYAETDRFVLVHAGLNFELEDPYGDEHFMLWTKDFRAEPDKIGQRRVIHGHVPVSLEFIDMVIKNENFGFVDLDNGIYVKGKEGFGNLVALELNSMEMVVQDNRDVIP